MKKLLFFSALALVFFGCKKDEESLPADNSSGGPNVIFRFAFDENQERLDNMGNPAGLPDGHAGQSPNFNFISAHYVEMIPNELTWLGDGEILYEGPETTAGGEEAIDFDQANVVQEGEDFLVVPLSSVSPGTYEFIRTSLSYQNFSVDFIAAGFELTGTLASFIGYNNYITSFTIEEQSVDVNENKLQGYWGFESIGQVTTGQAPEGATTVPNPLADTSPIPPGSCLVTGELTSPLTITGNETEDIIVTLSLSTNQSFEWVEVNEDGIWEPEAGENVVDMGIRGLIATAE
ncbi:hypothetical protein [Sanyastnella coralliicola]|uniref:hypothetical protein n=1 Tax=Sanyastnella coralliicola TaxID=3069118 RepID=UPI0027B9832F|nr:hypothetical protein [Longitalea sp. SCSIO 12813]